jgi:uncharacterized protein (TIRG00374 family)
MLMSMGKKGWIAIQGLVTIALLWWLTRAFDVTAFRALFLRLPLWFYVVSLLVVIGGQLLYAWRWQVLLVASGVRAPLSITVRQYFIGVFLNNFLPSTVGGDIAKVYLLGRDYGFRRVTASIFLDRMLGIGLLAACSAIAMWSAGMLPPALHVARIATTAIAGAAVALLALMAGGTGGLARRVAWLGHRAVDVAGKLQRLRLDVAAGLMRPVVVLQAALAVIVYFLALGAVYEAFVVAQGGHSPSFALLVGVVMATAVLSNIPISLNGLGLREQLHAALLAPFGLSKEAAVAISLLLFGHLLVASLFGLVFWLQGDVIPSGSAPLET